MIPLMAILAFMNSKSIDIKVYVRQKQMKLNETNNTDASAAYQSEPVSNEAMSYLSNANSPSANRTKYQRLQNRLIEIEIERTKEMNFSERLWYILTRFDYTIYMFCMTCLFVVVTGI